MTPCARFPSGRAPTARPRLEHLEPREVPAVVGGLDPSFGTGGKFTAFPTISTISGVAVDPAGRAVIAGAIAGAGGFDMVVVRLNPDGTPDATFGTGGKVTVDIAGGDDRARGVATDAAGNVVVAGTNNNSAAFVRLRAADGALDTTFGGGGTGIKVIAPPAGFNNLIPNDVTLDAAGDVIATGSALDGGTLKNSIAVIELTPDGASLAPGFNGGAIKTIAFVFGLNSNNLGQAVVIRGGNIVIGGQSQQPAPGAPNQFAVVRLLPNGNFDPGFAFGNGAEAFNLAPGSSDIAFGVDADAAGNIYLAGLSTSGAVSKVGVAKVDSAGNLDPTFGTGGVFRTSVGPMNSDEGDAVSVQPSGRVVVSGSSQVSVTDEDFFALQLTPAGTLDTGFNPTGPTPGINRFDFGKNAADFAGAATLTPQGRIVIAGANSTTGGVEVARLIGTVERPLRLSAGGSLDGRAAAFPPNFATGQYGAATSTPPNVFQGFGGNVRTAVADVNGDGVPDTILVTGPGTPIRFAVVSGKDNTTLLVPPTAPFAGSEGFTGGGFVAAADLDNDGRAEVILTPDQGGGPRVTIFSLSPAGALTTRANFFGIDDPNFRGGARAAAGDVNGDGVADLAVAAGFLGGPRVALFDGKTVFGTTPVRLVNDFFAFPGADATTLRNGAFVAVGDINADGKADLVFGGGPGGAPRVFVLSGALIAAGNVQGAYNAPVANFFVAGNGTDRGGVRVATADADGDNKAEVVAGSGQGQPARARVYLGKNFTTTTEPAAFQDLTPFGGAALADGIYVG